MRVGVEVGGTFTDVIGVDDDGTVRMAKVPSTPQDPSAGALDGLRALVAGDLTRYSEVLHGSTVATNAIIERKGAMTGLLTTRGFRDVLLLQRQERAEVYRVDYRHPTPLVTRNRIAEVDERLSAGGEVLRPLDRVQGEAVLREIAAQGIQSLAVSLLHAYRNPEHERLLLKWARDVVPELYISLSSQVAPVFREYERTSSTVISAYIRPLVDRYLDRFERELRGGGMTGTLFIVQSTGGILPSQALRENPAAMINSGPAAGVTGACHAAAHAGVSDFITLDIGGTSTDVSIVAGGVPADSVYRQIDGLALTQPSVDIISVGAGGGSLAMLDAEGLLQVGPRSAGAYPGPVSYGRGGTQPALTDALVAQHWIRSGHFLGGKMQLDREKAWTALGELAGRLQIPPAHLADSMVRLAVSNIERAVRLVSVQRGKDPRHFALFPYGGCGPMLAALVAQSLRIRHVYVPRFPGLLSAYGLLVTDLRRDFSRTEILPASRLTADAISDTFRRLQEDAAQELGGLGLDLEQVTFRYVVEARYSGQGYELTIPVDLTELQKEGTGLLKRRFDAAHQAYYGVESPDDVEVVTYRLTAVQERKITIPPSPLGSGGGAEEEEAWVGGATVRMVYYSREGLRPGQRFTGPAVVEEDTATTFLPAGWQLTVLSDGTLHLEGGEQA